MAEIRTKLSADTSELHNGLERARASVDGFGSKLKASAVGAAGGFLAAGVIIERTIDAFNHFGDIGDLSERFKVSAESLQRLGHVAEQTGSSAEAMAKGLQKVRLSLADAVNGSASAASVWSAAGVSLDAVRDGTVSAEQAMYSFSTYIAGTADETKKLSDVATVFGDKLAGEMLPVMEMGGEEMRRLGGSAAVMSEDMVGELKAASDQMKEFGNTCKVAFGYIAYGANIALGLFSAIGRSIGVLASAAIGDDVTDKDFADAWMPDKAVKDAGGPKGPLAPSGPTKEEVAAAKKEADEMAKARASLASVEREQDMARMDRHARINALERERVALLGEAYKLGYDTAAGVEKVVEAKRRELEIERERKAIAAEAAKEDAARAASLARTRDALDKASAEGKAAGDEAVAKWRKQDAFTAPLVSSLQAQGLGGNIGARVDPQVRLIARSNQLLEQTNAALAAIRAAQGMSATPAD